MRNLNELTTVDFESLNKNIKLKWDEVVKDKSLQNVYTPVEIVVDMLKNIDTNDNMDVLVMGNLDIYSLLKKLKSEEFITFKSIKVLTDIKRENNPEVINIDFRNIEQLKLDMKFDLVIGNPPFNLVTGDITSKDITKISGDKQLYKTFTKFGLKQLVDGGVMVFVTPKQIYGQLVNDKVLKNYQVDSLCFMDKSYWKYNTAYFKIINSLRSTNIHLLGDDLQTSIYRKTLDSTNTFTTKCVSRKKRDYYLKFITSSTKSEETPYEIIHELPGTYKKGKLPTIQTKYSSDVGKGYKQHKVLFTLLASEISICSSTLGVIGDNEAYVETSNQHESEQLIFLLKSNLVKYLIRSLSLSRGHYELLKYLKKVELNNTLSNELIYSIYNLTQEEIQLIEDTIK
jgi:hypothetical protein